MNGKLQLKFILSNDILNEKETKNTVRISRLKLFL